MQSYTQLRFYKSDLRYRTSSERTSLVEFTQRRSSFHADPLPYIYCQMRGPCMVPYQHIPNNVCTQQQKVTLHPYTNSSGDAACQAPCGAVCKHYVLRKSYLDLPRYSWVLFPIKAYYLARSTTAFGEIKGNSPDFLQQGKQAVTCSISEGCQMVLKHIQKCSPWNCRSGSYGQELLWEGEKLKMFSVCLSCFLHHLQWKELGFLGF